MEKIISKPYSIANNPDIAPREQSLLDRENGYRYLIVKNYKLIFSTDTKNGWIKVADVSICGSIR